MSVDRNETIVFLCECGPIIRDLIDLDVLGERAAAMESVVAVERYSTLCSVAGRTWIAERLADHPGARPVFAACSPREHADTLGAACESAGVNRYLMARANIREQCGWVTPDRAEATEKASHLVAAAVARAAENEALTAPEITCETNVLIIGSGIAGMSAALTLADAGRSVTLVEREASIGGRVVLLGELYPDMDCAPCLLEPVMDRVMHHANIEVLLQSELEELLGYLGNFTARIRVHPRHVAVDGCYGCHACSEACPVEVPNPVDCLLSTHKAVHVPYPGALPNASVVDESACLHFAGGECDLCVSACAFGAIDLGGQPEIVERTVGGVLLATGSELRTAGSVWESPGVLTTYEFERVLNPDGPTGGEIVLADGSAPTSIALVHCSDAEGVAPAGTCSKTCCLSLAKAGVEIAHKAPAARVVEFTWDRVLGGPHYARNETGPSASEEIRPDQGSALRVTASPTGGARVEYVLGGDARHVDVDLAVVAVPHGGSKSLVGLASELGVDLDADGFVLSANHRLRSFAARREGMFVAGSAQGPKNVTEAASQGAAAAGALLSGLLDGTTLVREAAVAVVAEELCGGCSMCVLSCPYRAVSFDAERRVAVVNELLCQGCGTCSATCPSSAITARCFSDKQLSAEMRALERAGCVSWNDR